MKRFILDIAKRAGMHALKCRTRNNKIFSKGDKGIVTEVDHACEKMIVSAIKSKFPNHSIITEELLSEDNDSDYVWFIDPIDGTTNYSQQYPLFCVSVALMVKGKMTYGCVYAPVLNEMFFAQLGKGAFLNNKKISVSQKKGLVDAVLATGFAYERSSAMYSNLKNIGRFLEDRQTQSIRIDGSAALDLCYVACGRYDGFWEFNLQPWDLAAGCLIIEEAGGKVTNSAGKRWSPFNGRIVSSNTRLHVKMLKVLKGR